MSDDATWQALAKSPEVARFLGVPRTAVYIVRDDGHIVWGSDSMRQVLGRAPGQVVGGNGWDLLVPPEDLQDVARFKAHLSEADGVLWMRIVMPDGGRAWYRVDAWVRRGFILCAFRAENDPAQHFIHFTMNPRPRGA